jgi:hypothetical protein
MKDGTFNKWYVIGAIVASAATLTAFAFQTFETKDDAKEKKGDIVERLIRIEGKVDTLLTK